MHAVLLSLVDGWPVPVLLEDTNFCVLDEKRPVEPWGITFVSKNWIASSHKSVGSLGLLLILTWEHTMILPLLHGK